MPYASAAYYAKKSWWELLRIPTTISLTFLVMNGLVTSNWEAREQEHKQELANKSFTVQKSQVGNQIKQCEALRESTNSYHAGNWRIEVNDKGTRVECVQEGYRIPR